MKIRYQNKIVAFIDVLGFSNIVFSNTTEPINKYFEFVFDNFKKDVQKKQFDFLIISDSIVISANLSKENLRLMLHTLCFFQANLLCEGILLRGGISFGSLYLSKSKNIIVGPGMINAYKLESKAIYPRIILDRKLISLYYDGTVSALDDLQFKKGINFLLFDPPSPYLTDFPYINYTNFLSRLNNVAKISKQLISFLKANLYNNEYTEKYEWLRKHLLISIHESIELLRANNPKLDNTKRKVKALEQFMIEFTKL